MKLAISLLLASSFWMGNAIAEENNSEALSGIPTLQEEALEVDQLNEQGFMEEQSNPNPLSFDFNALDESLMRGGHGGHHNGGHHNGGHHNGGHHNGGHHNGHWNGHHGNHHWHPVPRYPFPRFATTCFAQNGRRVIFRVRGFGSSWALQNEAVRFCRRNSVRPNSCRPIGCRR